ncbi:hypothetical protein Scep_000398 [Stephania cephalantha]|uniref:HVA22-like protein n=1 Tax=Stephania cephalantha TaxID=152367 RepID=A0AAP0L609_9MAGN
MMGSFLTRGLVMVFGYAYPAYECFKTVEKNKPEIDQLRFWCQYWILVAMLTVFERVGDAFISWVPMYSEAKLAFFIYLWYPKTKGTRYIYDSFFRPYISKHETEIDRNIMELRTRAGDIAVLYWQRAATYGQTRVFEILQYIASQSTARPQPAQRQRGEARQPPSTAETRQQAASTIEQQPQQPPSRNNTGLTQRAVGSRQAPAAAQTGQHVASASQQQQQPPSRSNSASSTQQPPSRSNSTGSTQQPPSRSNSTGSAPQPPSRSNSTGSTQLPQAPSHTLSTGTNQQKQESEPGGPSASAQKQTAAASQPASQLTQSETDAAHVDPGAPSAKENENPLPETNVMEETIMMTRARLKKARSTANR